MQLIIERATRFVIKHIELLVVVLILASVLLMNFLVPHKVTMIAFYFLPVLVAGYTQGVRLAVLTAVFATAAVIFWAVINPASFALPPNSLSVYGHLAAWSAFLILSGVVVGKLYSEKEKRLVDIRAAYAGILEILFGYLESPRKDLRAHVGRVAEQAAHIAMHLNMSDSEVQAVRTAALLHEIRELKVAPEHVRRAADLSLKEKRMMDLHCQEGGAILQKLGAILHKALPIIMAHQQLSAIGVSHSEALAQAGVHVQVLHMADSYDVLTVAQGLAPDFAASEILRSVHRSVHPDVLEAFARVAELAQVSHPPLPKRQVALRRAARQPQDGAAVL